MDDEGRCACCGRAGRIGQVCNALEASHRIGIVHRDVRPENILLQEVPGDPNFVRVLDFGLAKFVEEGGRSSVMMGTPVYMAPEQVSRGAIGPWTDLYSLGVMLCEFVQGKRAFSAQSRQEPLARKPPPEALPVLDAPAFLAEATRPDGTPPGAAETGNGHPEHHPFAGHTTQEVLEEAGSVLEDLLEGH